MTLHINKSIVLVGLMGVGKSTVGKRLANKLEIGFVDIDQAIEKSEGMKISKIFEEKGEPYFREVEKGLIEKQLNKEPLVIATGGGAFMQKDTRELIKHKAISVWLRAGIDTMVSRVSKNNDRPLLAKGNKREILENLMEERNDVYAESDLIIDSDDGPHYKVVDQIIWKL